MPDNTWYYSLSTISQTLAAILGLFAVFVVFKLDKINNTINGIRAGIVLSMASLLDRDSSKYYFYSDDELREVARKFLTENNGIHIQEFHDDEYGIFKLSSDSLVVFEKIIAIKRDVGLRLIFNLIVTAIPIVTSVTSLLFSDSLFEFRPIIYPVLFGLVSVSIGYTVYCIYQISVVNKSKSLSSALTPKYESD